MLVFINVSNNYVYLFFIFLDERGNIKGYVLKIMTREETKNEIHIRAVHSLQTFLKHHGFICAAPLQNIYGDDMKIEEFYGKQKTGKVKVE